MRKPVIHLLSVGGSDRELVEHLGLNAVEEIIGAVQDLVGSEYRVTGNVKLMNAVVDERRGGRSDDAARARDLQRALGDDRVRAVVSLRGGSWLARVLPRVDFGVLKPRKTVVHVFGFSELTTLVNIVSRYSKARAHYDMGPGYLMYGLRNYALANADLLASGLGVIADPDAETRTAFAMGWAAANFKLEFGAFFLDVVGILSGKPSRRELTGALLRGELKSRQTIRVVGGCLSTMVTLLGSRLQSCLDTKDRWLAIEDIREELYRIDRYLAQLKLAGTFERCAGLLIGNVTRHGEDLTDGVMRLLPYHLPPRRRIPIIGHANFGHCYPMASLPLNQPLTLLRTTRGNRRHVRFVSEG